MSAASASPVPSAWRMGLLIRPVMALDATGLAHLRAAVGWETASVDGQLAAHAAGQRTVLVALRGEDGALVGAVTVEWHDPQRPDLADGRTVAHINDRAVHPSVQGQGIGHALMDAAEQCAAGRGYQAVVVQVPPTLPHVRAEVLRRGYVLAQEGAEFAVLRLELAPLTHRET